MKLSFKKAAVTVCLLAALTITGLLVSPRGKAFAQGVATVVGQIFPVNQFQNTSATGLAGAVTNPSSNFVVQVAGGQIYCAGAVDTMAQTQLSLTASQTYLLVYNCPLAQVYAKQAVTGPGSNGTSAINGPGFPTSLLFADPQRGEIALATVVCNATACGNGGNGSITDNRPLAAFPAGLYLAGHLNTASSNKDIAGSGASPLTVTFANAFQATPLCFATDASGTPAVITVTTCSTTQAVFTGTAGHTMQYLIVGNPN